MDDIFKCDEQYIVKLKAYAADIKNVLRDTCNAGQIFINEIKGSTEWMGAQKDAFVSFMDLIQQYHGRLNGGYDIDNNPAEEAENILTEFLNEFVNFYSNSAAYRELEGIE